MAIAVRIRNGLAKNGMGQGGATEGDIRGDLSDMVEQDGGVVDLSGGHCLVHQNSPTGMSVVVDTGVGYIPNSDYSPIESDSIKFWEAVVETAQTVTIGANSSGQTRIDLICLYLNVATTPNNTATNIVTAIAVAGTPGGGAPAVPNDHLLLAEVTVANGASSIVNANISDERVQITLKPEIIGAGSGDLVTTTGTQDLTNKTVTLGKWVGEYDNGNSGTSKTISWANGDRQKITMTGNCTFTFSNATAGQTLTLRHVQDGTGGRTSTYPTLKWPGGTVGVPTTTASAINLYIFYYDGTNYLAQLAAGFA